MSALFEHGFPNAASKSYIDSRIDLIGECERHKLASIDLSGLDPAQTSRLLGWGFALTEFLIAPVLISAPDRMRVCSLAAIVNLIVVTSDHLLDRGGKIEQPLTGAGYLDSPLKRLELHYFRCLSAIDPESQLVRTIKKIIIVMYEAEIETTGGSGRFSHKSWLRKCCLPFVLMGLPAWTEHSTEMPGLFVRHLRWLYRAGRFLGALDDAVDYLDDWAASRPNYFNESGRTESVIGRVAGWGVDVLEEWDSVVPKTSETALSRETFLHAIWGW